MSQIQDTDQEELVDTGRLPKVRRLQDAIDIVRTRDAERDDRMSDARAADQASLEKLAAEIRPILEDIDETDERFEFALTNGEKPRLWIDMTAFVTMGQDQSGYRLLKDTRMGRIVLAETKDVNRAADIVSEYVAEKVLERERMLEGERLPLRSMGVVPVAGKKESSEEIAIAKMNAAAEKVVAPVKRKKFSLWKSGLWFLFGTLCCLAALAVITYFISPSTFQELDFSNFGSFFSKFGAAPAS